MSTANSNSNNTPPSSSSSKIFALSQATKNKIQKIQDIIGQDDGGRGMKSLIVPNDLEKAAFHITTSLSSMKTKENDAHVHVVILSGFPCCIHENPPTETDGPPGTVAIAKCILGLVGSRSSRCISKSNHHVTVTIVTDECNEAVFRAAIGKADSNSDNKIHLEVFPSTQNMKEEDYKRMKQIANEKCDILIACERAGPGIDGKCYTMRGIDMTSMGLIAPLHEIVDMVRNKNNDSNNNDDDKVKFIAIGDGGNELGMGKVIDKIHTNPKIPNGNLIGAVTSADHLIAASVSNWGGYALAAACALVKSDIEQSIESNDADKEKENIKYWVEKCIPSTKHEIDLLDRCVDAGCRDGVSGKMEATVDGMPLKTSLDCLQSITNMCVE